MGLIELLVLIAVVGLIVYLIDTYVPMDPPIKVVFRVVVLLVLILWLLRAFVGDIPIPFSRVR